VSKAIVEVRDLTKKYGDVEALRGVSFQIDEGEIFGLLGPNGAGKTTTIEILEGMRTADGGTASVSGFDPQKAGPQFKRSVGAVLQSTSLPDKIRVDEALSLFAQLYGAHPDRTALLRRFGLEEKRHAFYGKLSGGQKQRLAIARALIHDPRILILDEATSALDPESEALVNANIQRIAYGRTMIIVSHRLSSLTECDLTLVLDRGKVMDIGPHKELVDRCPVYRQLWLQQNRHLETKPIGPKPVLAQGD